MTANITQSSTTKENLLQWQDIGVELLNDIFTPLNFEARIKLLYKYFKNDEVLFTSSFGTSSVFLLHLVSQINSQQKVHFINTTYHFPETLEYKALLTDLFNLEIEEVLPNKIENQLTKEEEWWVEHPKMCCSINKVVPIKPIVAEHKVWISGLMAYQTEFRSHLRVFERQGDIIKFHPLIDIDEGEVLFYQSYHNLPKHPLLKLGYGSVGCTHCTVKGIGREGRWKGKAKTECGLHPTYFLRKMKKAS